MQRVLLLDPLAPEGVELLARSPAIEFETRTGLQGTPLATALNECDGAICRSGVRLTAEALEGNRRLRAIVRAGVGTDNIDKEAATRSGVVVMNAPTGNTVSTAEHTIALMLALSRNIAPAYQGLIQGRWDRKRYLGSQLAGKTLGIIGLGRIGRAVAARAKALEMIVLGYDPFYSAERIRALGMDAVDAIEQLLPKIDYLTVHTPLTEETKGLISQEQLELLRPGARLVNCARGGIYDELALIKGLKQGRLGGVALDVFTQEPCTDSPLFGMPGVVCTPHLGASTEEAQTQVAKEAVELMIDFLTEGTIRHAVNMAPLDPNTLEGLGGYLEVAYRLGLFAAGLCRSGAESCEVIYQGEITNKDTKVLTTSFAAGLLQDALDEDVNLVNAEILLRERGIDLVERSHGEKGAFSSAMTIQISVHQLVHRATATVFGQKKARLVELEDYQLEASLDGWLFLFSHQDVPGIIGTVGTIFGNHNTNIAQMAVGRAGQAPGGAAIGVLNLDNEPSSKAVEEVRAHPAITQAIVIRMPREGELPLWLHK